MLIRTALPLLALVACDADHSARLDVTVDQLRQTSEGEPIDPDPDSDGKLPQCGDAFDGADVVVVTGDQNHVVLEPTDVLGVRVAGNHNEVTITPQGSADDGTTTEGGPTWIAGLCLVLRGNQPRATVSLGGIDVDRIAVIATGNQPEVTVDVLADANVGAIELDLRGNGGRFQISGPGDFDCPDPVGRGSGLVVDCP